MATLRKVLTSDAAAILELLKDFQADHISNEDWLRLFQDWSRGEQGYFGFGLFTEEKAVGFLGGVFSRRQLDGQPRLFCNLTSWIVKPEYRSQSVVLLHKLLGEKGCVYTNFSPDPKLLPIFLKMGFQVINRFIDLFAPVPTSLRSFASIKIVTDPKEIPSYLTAEEHLAFTIHKFPGNRHLVIDTPEGSCYLVLSASYRSGIPFSRVNYIGNRPVFLRYLAALRWRLPWELKTFGLLVETRNMQNQTAPLRLRSRGLILSKANDVDELAIDSLYTEVLILKQSRGWNFSLPSLIKE